LGVAIAHFLSFPQIVLLSRGLKIKNVSYVWPTLIVPLPPAAPEAADNISILGDIPASANKSMWYLTFRFLPLPVKGPISPPILMSCGDETGLAPSNSALSPVNVICATLPA
jgi:hypothetical protein